ncbi:MAG: peptidylprolyl isomerase [Gammaproteobacteria bacterium]
MVRPVILLVLALLAGTAGAADAPRVTLVTSHGDVTVELFAEQAPKSVANFLDYVRSGFYDGTIFHRVIPGFMIQGGGFDRAMTRKETRAPIENEAANGLANARGTLAMARTSDPHSASAQFFINVVDNDFLDHREPTPRGWGYAVFGRVVAGMDVVDAIAAAPTGNAGGMGDVPLEAVVIEHAREAAATADAP